MDGDYYEQSGESKRPQHLIQDADHNPAIFDSFFAAAQDAAVLKDGKTWNAQDLRQQLSRTFENSSLFPNENTAIGALFPEAQAELSWRMPGEFKTPDAMDLDQSPPFTVELDLYFDAITPTINDDRAPSGLTPTMFDGDVRQQEPDFAKQYESENGEFGFTSTENQQLRNNNNDTYNFQMQLEEERQQMVDIPTFNINTGTEQNMYTQAFTDPSQMASQTMSDIYTPDESVFQNASIATPEEDFHNMQSQSGTARRDIVRHRGASLLAHGADLLPLTTTTSLTPSLSSLHLTQPSFFSASQFVRSLFDQPPSLVHRPSIDLYSRQRLSIDSLNSGVPPVQNSTRSFSSYIPFMGDRDREHKLPGTLSATEWTQPGTGQPRHLIRSIFKSNSAAVENPDSTDPTEDPMLTDPYDEDHLEMIQEDVALKKTKRPRRSLFTRLRPRKLETERQENSFSEALKSDTQESESSMKLDHRVFNSKQTEGNDFVKLEGLTPENSRLFALEAELIKTETQSSLRSSEKDIVPNYPNSNIQALVDSQEPDYAALFQGVGKRRNLVVMKGKKTKSEFNTKTDVIKQEPDVSAERLSLTNVRLSNDDGHLSQSLTFSQASSVSNESHLDGQSSNGGSTFANASKRILGSRLLKRRGNTTRFEPQAEPPVEHHSDVVEIDLQSLDLPANTEILPQINPKSRTRGRKEDKAADMEDQSKIYVCGYCTRRFKRQEHLKRHFRSLHTSEKPYECPICQKKFSRTDNLNQHLKVHKQEDGEHSGDQSDE